MTFDPKSVSTEATLVKTDQMTSSCYIAPSRYEFIKILGHRLMSSHMTNSCQHHMLFVEEDTYFRRPRSEAMMNFRHSVLSCMRLNSSRGSRAEEDTF